MGNALITIGLFVVLAGVIVTMMEKWGMPHLPGDILIQKPGVRVYIPIVSSIVLSVLLTVALNLFRK